jgi:FkbM family methyltransferase
MKVSNPIPIKHRIYGSFSTIKNKFIWFNLYKKTYKNFLNIILQESQNDFPINVVLRNNETKFLNSKDEIALYALLTEHNNVNYDEKNDYALFDLSNLNFKLKEIKLYGIKQNLDALLAFNDGTYEKLPLKNKLVVDVGACTGDTSIYFAICGAKKVIAIEPYPKNFEMLEKNIEINHLEKLINPKLAGCASKSSYITIDPNFKSTMRSNLKEFETGVKIPLVSLIDIIKDEDFTDGILKLDCEGCEYDIILESPKSLLQKFSHIQIEYHMGYENIKQKLESCGFKVNVIKIENSKMGHLLAQKY